MNALLRAIQQTPAPHGTAVLWWFGQMGLIVKMGSTVLSVDYYASPLEGRQTPPPVPSGMVAIENEEALFVDGIY